MIRVGHRITVHQTFMSANGLNDGDGVVLFLTPENNLLVVPEDRADGDLYK